MEVFSFKVLEEAYFNAKGEDREHVTFYFWKKNKLFKTAQLDNKNDWSNHRYTVDYEEDYQKVSKILEIIKKKVFGYTSEIIKIIEDNNLEQEKKSLNLDSVGKTNKLIKIKVLLRCDAGTVSDIGTGHVIRTLRLCEELKSKNWFKKSENYYNV